MRDSKAFSVVFDATAKANDPVETLRVLPSGGEMRFDSRGRLVEIRIPSQGKSPPHQHRRDTLDEAEALIGQRLRLVSWKVQPDGDYVKVAPAFLPRAETRPGALTAAPWPRSEPRNDS